MDVLKLAALDKEDLTVISACCQDAVLKIGEINVLPNEKRLVLPLNRYAWEKNGKRLTIPERRRAVLHFDRVLSVQSHGIDRKKPDEVLSLLAIRFVETNAPSGTVELVFAGEAMLRIEVECIEVQLSDLGATWAAKATPKHGV
jgi:Protein of unknown function (DUF2948)